MLLQSGRKLERGDPEESGVGANEGEAIEQGFAIANQDLGASG